MNPAYERVKAARAKERPTGLDYIGGIFTDFFGAARRPPLRRRSPPSSAASAYLDEHARDGCRHRKGRRHRRTRLARNFGAPSPEGYRKALRLMQQAEKFHRPVLCFVDTSGACCGIGAEERKARARPSPRI